jgi:hypothetical protein
MEEFIKYCKDNHVNETALAALQEDVQAYNVPTTVQFINREYPSLGKKLVLKADNVLVEYEASGDRLIKSQILGLNIQTELL